MKLLIRHSFLSVLAMGNVTLVTAASAQVPDTVASDSMVDAPAPARTLRNRSSLLLSTGRTYNRVEGLPVHFGPVFETQRDSIRLAFRVMGIVRSADTFRSDGGNVGHDASVRVGFPGSRRPAVAIRAYDVVDAVEDWQIPAGEAGLAAFFFHSDFRDHFGRHGVSYAASFAPARRATFELSLARERWSSRQSREVLTVLRNNQAWRPNPVVDEGVFRVLTGRLDYDSRNDPTYPSTGWLASARYETGWGIIDQFGPLNPAARKVAGRPTSYGRMLLDVRKYMRLAPQTELHARMVLGGWAHGDELPVQRRVSVGGLATIPGIDFRSNPAGPDVGQCSTPVAPAGDPAQCERVALFQVEYRTGLQALPGTIFDGDPIRLRVRSRALTLRPALVAFADAGRGWLLPPRANDRQVGNPHIDIPAPRLVYSTGGVPPLKTFRTDVGLGVDLGLFGLYVAKSLSESKEPANVFLRARRRF